jgi:hypothetical protein
MPGYAELRNAPSASPKGRKIEKTVPLCRGWVLLRMRMNLPCLFTIPWHTDKLRPVPRKV